QRAGALALRRWPIRGCRYYEFGWSLVPVKGERRVPSRGSTCKTLVSTEMPVAPAHISSSNGERHPLKRGCLDKWLQKCLKIPYPFFRRRVFPSPWSADGETRADGVGGSAGVR